MIITLFNLSKSCSDLATMKLEMGQPLLNSSCHSKIISIATWRILSQMLKRPRIEYDKNAGNTTSWETDKFTATVCKLKVFSRPNCVVDHFPQQNIKTHPIFQQKQLHLYNKTRLKNKKKLPSSEGQTRCFALHFVEVHSFTFTITSLNGFRCYPLSCLNEFSMLPRAHHKSDRSLLDLKH